MKYAINEVIEENKLLSMVFSLEISKCGNVMGVYVGKAPPPKWVLWEAFLFFFSLSWEGERCRRVMVGNVKFLFSPFSDEVIAHNCGLRLSPSSKEGLLSDTIWIWIKSCQSFERIEHGLVSLFIFPRSFLHGFISYLYRGGKEWL